MPVRVGICGYGKMGQIRAEAAASHGAGEVARVYDVAYDGTPPYPQAASVEEIVADPEIDAVFVCLPNHMNKDTTIAALRAGKHVFCEKPPAFTGDEVREIRAVEAESGKVLMYGFNHRHHAAIAKMKEIVERGFYGDVLWMRGRYGKSVDEGYLQGWRADKALAGGGILLDQGIHMLDLMLYLSNDEFDDVHAFVQNLYWKTPGIEDNVFAIMRNSRTGVAASLHSTMTQWRHLFSLEVFLERGYLVLNGLKTSSGTYGEEVLTIAKNRSTAPAATWEDEERLRFEVDTSWSREAELFFDSVLFGAPVRYGSSEQAERVMDHIDRIYANERQERDVLHQRLGG